MKDKIIIISALGVIISLTGGGYWLWHTQQNFRSEQAASVREEAKTFTAQPSQDTSSNGLQVSQAADPLGTLDAASDGSLQSQGLAVNKNTNTQSESNKASQNSSSSSNEVTLEPTKFGLYEKYKDATSAMFAEITTGNGSVAGAGKKVHVNYRGWLTNGTIFDENLDAGKPFAFTLGAGNVIPGWEQTVAGMKVGGERLLIIPPSVGYGTKGQGPVPANAIMIFYVKLLSVD